MSLFLFGCGSKINQANYDKIKTEMTEAEVEAILGKPTETSSNQLGPLSVRSSKWKDKNGTISIQFFNGKVQAKQFVSGDSSKQE